ncbi:gelsolin repeat protein [Teladorsagia circumcincta]|uniref:Gelsolin repeat protein n=1 Tax=Teladorsagia circumcincta TaxID=45464 RepID=A0A2G9UG19_TELCI|nr:gelsolin repeat protein [Teladorsagia circumcincta]
MFTSGWVRLLLKTRYMAGGYESGFHHVEDKFKDWKPKLFHCKGKRNVRCHQDAFVLDAGSAGIFVWVGKGCTQEERAKALIIGTDFIEAYNLPKWTTVTRVLESAEPASFTQWFDEWVDTKTTKTFEPHLFQVSDKTGGMNVEEIANYNQESLDGDDVMILDALNRIYVWKYLRMGKLPRHEKTTIETIYQGKETPGFKSLFPKWDDKLFKSVSVRVVPVK